ncbi:MAG TPA: hypothetical protein VFV34_12620, partial [Blastocatellia bacterium]|nr:hypothetical protein [Blastocatellia bacterium]
GLVQFGISPEDKDGESFIVVASVNPWCTSNWHSVRYAVLREGPTAHEPRVILETSRWAFLGNDPVYSLTVGRSSFTLALFDEKSFEFLENDGYDIARTGSWPQHILKYRVSGSDVTNVLDEIIGH